MRPWRTTSFAMTLFAVLALLLALTGVHGLVAYAVSTEARELAVRMALGATPARVVRLVVSRVTRPALLGFAIGIPLALLAARVTSALLFGVRPLDAPSYLGGCVMLLLAVAAACAQPAHRAASLDPMEVLRAD
jgi:ABC-type antimicrobial peptide transport system permease subunit